MNTKTNLAVVTTAVAEKLFCPDHQYLSDITLTTAQKNKALKIAKQKVGSAILLKQLAKVSPHVKARNIVVKGL